jgi:hypothetical protein
VNACHVVALVSQRTTGWQRAVCAKELPHTKRIALMNQGRNGPCDTRLARRRSGERALQGVGFAPLCPT